MLAAGEGRRLRPLTETRPKVMIPIANKPVLEHVLVNAKQAGLTDFVLVVSYKKDTIVDYFGDGKKWGVHIEYVHQLKPLGTADAIGTVADVVDDRFVVLSGDTYIGTRDIKKLLQTNHVAMGIKQYEQVESYGTVMIRNNQVRKIAEKTSDALSRWINLGVYLFDRSIFDSITQTAVSQRGEFEITESLQRLIDTGNTVDAVAMQDWMDSGRPWDLLEMNEYLLQNQKRAIQGTIEDHVTIKGSLVLGKGSQILSGTYIEGPVVIGEHCKIGPNCYLRPATTIGDHCHIGNACEIKNSIIMNNTKIPHQNYIGDSIIGEHCNLGAGTKIANLRLDKKPVFATVDGIKMDTGRRKFGAIIGDHVQTGINVTINVGTTIGSECFIGPGAVVSEEVATGSTVL